MKKWLIALTALLVLPASALAQEMEMEGHDEMAHEQHEAMVEEVTAAVEAASAAFAEAFSAGDAEAAAAMYTEDAVVLPPGSDAVEGRAAIQEAMAADMAAMGDVVMTFETTEVQAMHRQALEVGSYTVEGADGTHLDHGKFMVVWTHTDDGWKMTRDIWNSSMGGGM
ncbi:MAG TPA: nuclear transport factor 2 family protein [Gemmatimonadota bacterium]|nr:nuclear transport factor 2 family protein [Gemmatimonadota bacterium]